MTEQETRRFHVLLTTLSDVHECELNAGDAVVAGVIARANYASDETITHVMARPIEPID